MKCIKCNAELCTADKIEMGLCQKCYNETYKKKYQTYREKNVMPIIIDNTAPHINLTSKKILLVEDGSVDTAKLDTLGIDYIVYRQGSTPPRIVELEGDE